MLLIGEIDLKEVFLNNSKWKVYGKLLDNPWFFLIQIDVTDSL